MRRPSAFPLLILLCQAVAAAAEPAPLSLDQAIELAHRSSDAIRLSRLALEKSQAAVGEARAKALPHVDLEASASYLVNPPPGYSVAAGSLGSLAIPSTTPPFTPQTYLLPPTNFNVGAALHNYFSVTAALNQPLFTWGKIRNAIELAALQADSAGIDMNARQRDIDWQVRRAYFSALLAERSREVLRRMRDTAQEVVADRQKNFDQGTMTRESLLEVKATLASVEAKLAEAAQSDSTALVGLGILTGLDPADIRIATDFRPSLPALDEQSILMAGLEGSTDMKTARTRSDQARRKLSVEQGGAIFRPDFNLGISVDVSGQEDFPYSGAWTFSNNTWNFDVMFTLGMKMSAFDGMESASRIRQAEKDVDMAGTALSQQAKLVRLQVRQAVEAAIRADAAAQEAKAQADYLEEKLRNAQVALSNGLASREDERNASIQADSAELDLLLALYNRESALADIGKITGEQP